MMVASSTMAVQKAVNFEVDGSSPSWPVKPSFRGLYIFGQGLLVEWLRCVPFTDETRGSIPLQAISGIIRL